MFTPGFKIKALAHLFFEDIKVEKSERKMSFFFKKVCRSSTVFNRELVL